MKWIVTTSDNYHHCLPVFFRQWEKHVNLPCELVGYKRPDNLPDYCNFVSLGVQRDSSWFTVDLRKYFSQQPDFFVWVMEDTFIKGFDVNRFNDACEFVKQYPLIGKFCLTNEAMKREHDTTKKLFIVDQYSYYRLSSQPAIWNKKYLVWSMRRKMNVWRWEKQYSTKDKWQLVGFQKNVIEHNEGVRKDDINKLNLDGIEL